MSEILKQAVALAAKIQSITEEVLAAHIQRGDMVKAFWLSLITGRPAFFLGGFGIDKTGTIRSVVRCIKGLVFWDELVPNVGSPEQMLVDGTEIVESVDESGAKHIRVREKLGKAATAHVIFFDEKYKAQSPTILHAVIDLTKGDGIRHEGRMVQTPLLTSLGASNEVPGQDDNLGANWSRETIRVYLKSLDRAGKQAMIGARLRYYTAPKGGSTASVELTLEEVGVLRQARKLVGVSDEIVNTTLDILQELVDETASDFKWAWDDDRRFGRLFDVMQANALLAGRTVVSKADLAVLEWLLWDTPEQIPVLKGKLARYTRTPLTDAQEAVDALLSPSGTVEVVRGGDRGKGVQAITQCETALTELNRLKGEAADGVMSAAIADLLKQVEAVKADVIAVVTGAKAPGGK